MSRSQDANESKKMDEAPEGDKLPNATGPQFVLNAATIREW